jgi:hypothetical protein
MKAWVVRVLYGLRAALPIVMRKFPQLALWAGAIYAAIDIIIKLIG